MEYMKGSKMFLAIAMILLIMVISYKLGWISREGYQTLEYSNVPLLWDNTPKQPKGTHLSEYVLLTDSFPLIWDGRSKVNMKDQWQKWWHYPTFKVGSYTQITNNIRYPNNPDIATCTPDEFCGALYHEQQYKTNVYQPIPPVQNEPSKIRVGYYNTA
jgi:hypothetical protein